MEKGSPPTRRVGYHHGDLKAQLIEATRQLVETKGPEHFSVAEACRAAGVSTAAPYKHFKTKEEMLQEVAIQGMSRQQRQMREELAPYQPGTIERIVALGRVYTRFAVDEPGVFRLMFGLTDEHHKSEELKKVGQETFEVVQLECARCRGSETITEADVRKAFLLWGFVHGLAFLQIDRKVSDLAFHFENEAILLEIAERVMGDAPTTRRPADDQRPA